MGAAVPGEPIYVLTAKELEEPPRRTILPSIWRYNPGDDPAFAAHRFDHSSWAKLDTRMRRGQIPSDWGGIGWFRFRLQVDPELHGVPLGILVRHMGAAEIYLNGEMLYALGTASADPEGSTSAYQRQPFLFSFDNSREHVLAIRYANHEPESFGEVGLLGGFTVTVGEANHRVSIYGQDLKTLSSYQAFFTGVFACFALLHLLLYAFYREATENLYFALLSGAVALLVYLFLHNHFTTNPHFFTFYDRGMNTARLLLCLFALRFVYSVFYTRLPRGFYLILATVLGLVAPAWLWPVEVAPWILILLLLTSIEMFRAVVVALVKRKAGAGVVGLGILTLATGLTVGLLANLGVLPSSIITAFLVPFCSMFILMVTMSVYLSRKFAQTNLDLRAQLLQVRELSEHKLDQERRVREDEVKRTLLEAEYGRKVAELEEARNLQLSMLPESLPRLPDLEVAADMKTATEVGGDYYDFDLADDGTLTIAIGDATGHGMRAGTMVTATKSLFNALGQDANLSQTLGRFARALKRMNLRQLSMALTLAKFKAGRLRLAAAGMPPPLIYRADSSTVETVMTEGMPLGSLAAFPYQQKEVVLQPGDTVLLMSDGFPERLNDDHEMMGYDQAREAFFRAASTSPRTIIGHLVAHGESWANGQPAHDDMTFVVLRMRSHLSPAQPAATRPHGSTLRE